MSDEAKQKMQDETADNEQKEKPFDFAQGKREFICDRCGFEMYEKNCKVICPNCGNRFDCSDLNIYFD